MSYGIKNNQNDTSFFNKKVFKPIRGGGPANQSSTAGGMDFKNFMQ